jgi:O-antigen/teichoic acid export membrane protein
VFVANGLNALFQIALARVLSPAEYSVLVALIVITLIAAVPPLAFQASVAREVALELDGGHRARAGAALRDTVRGLAPWAVSVLVLGGIASVVMAAAGRGDAAATFATTATIAFALVIRAVWGRPARRTALPRLRAGPARVRRHAVRGGPGHRARGRRRGRRDGGRRPLRPRSPWG